MKFIEKSTKYYFHYPFPVAVIGAIYNGKTNFMAAAWHTQLSFDPALYGVAISPKRYTNELIAKSGMFSLNFLRYDDYKISGFFGRTSGRDLEKAKFFGINYTKGKILDVPVLECAVSCYECKVVESKAYSDHILYVGEIVAIHYDEEFYETGLSKNLLLYAGNDIYTTLSKEHMVKFGKEEVLQEIYKKKGE
ncbi:MAG: flavin reductase family protein [Fervidobacterium sp.]